MIHLLNSKISVEFRLMLMIFICREKIDKIPDVKRNIRDSLTVCIT